jgi:hypothetical protein
MTEVIFAQIVGLHLRPWCDQSPPRIVSFLEKPNLGFPHSFLMLVQHSPRNGTFWPQAKHYASGNFVRPNHDRGIEVLMLVKGLGWKSACLSD